MLAVIFDMDGVLVDTEPLHYRINQLVMEAMGHELPYEYYRQFIGSTNTHMWNTLIRDYGLLLSPDELNAMAAKKKEEIIAREGYPEIAGAREFVASLKKAGIKLAVASSSAPFMIDKMTAGVGVREYFDELVSGETVERPKPAPDVFLKAADMLGVRPSECLVIEDSENGTKAARAAGMACLGFINPGSGVQDLSAADYLFEAYEGIDAEFVRMVYARHHDLPLTIAETERLIIREFTPGDFEEVCTLHREQDICREIADRYYPDEEGKARFLSYIKQAYSFYGYGYWALIEKATGELVGEAGIAQLAEETRSLFHAEEDALELGYAIKRKKRRRGYAKEACLAIMEYAKTKLEIPYLTLVVRTDNHASAALAEALGFKKTGEERERCQYGRNL